MRCSITLVSAKPAIGWRHRNPAGRVEIIELARDLAHNKGMSLIFSSHLLPDVEAVCDYIVVLGSGRLLAEGKIQDLKQLHKQWFEVRLKAGPASFAQKLTALGCETRIRDDMLQVHLPQGQSPQLIWQAAAEHKEQVRYLRPQRSTLEEVFLNAVEEK
jgi:ABC-2 type transport system ATP-binding protein